MNLEGLEKNDANYVPLSPLSFLLRAARVYPHRTATIYNGKKRTWQEVHKRCMQFAAALKKNDIGKGDVVSILAVNTPEIFEAHFAVPMAGAVLNAINVRLDMPTLRYIFEHSETKMIFVDGEFAAKTKEAVSEMKNPPMLIDITDDSFDGGEKVGECDYEEFIKRAKGEELFLMPDDEWQPITLNYTSGTTGNPKGVVYHHRGAYLMASGTAVGWEMKTHGVLLYTVPMFHCNGWCYPWTQALLAGEVVCIRKIDGDDILRLISEYRVDYMGGAPIVLSTVIAAANGQKLPHKVKLVTAAAPPPPSTLQAAEAMGFEVMHVYGLTETYGHTTMCAWKSDLWDSLPSDERAEKMIRQGVGYPILEDWAVMVEGKLAPADGKTMGEIVMRGNTVMSGYLKNPDATKKAFADGWFHTGDLAVQHDDDYLQIKDRLKDIIISGGENISSIAVENAINKHPAVAATAVVAKPDDKWGETPCAFVELAPGQQADEKMMTEFCRENLPGFMRPRHFVFGELPKTATGKIKKFELREKAKTI